MRLVSSYDKCLGFNGDERAVLVLEENMLADSERKKQKFRQARECSKKAKESSREVWDQGKRVLRYSKKKGSVVAEQLGARACEVREEVSEIGVLEYSKQMGEKVKDKGLEMIGTAKGVGGKLRESATPYVLSAKATGSKILDSRKVMFVIILLSFRVLKNRNKVFLTHGLFCTSMNLEEDIFGDEPGKSATNKLLFPVPSASPIPVQGHCVPTIGPQKPVRVSHALQDEETDQIFYGGRMLCLVFMTKRCNECNQRPGQKSRRFVELGG